MRTKKQMKITVPPMEERLEWVNMEDLPYDAEVIMEIVHRYCDSQDHAKNYRTRRADEFKMLKALKAEGKI